MNVVEITKHTNAMVMFIAMEGLYRKGLVKLYHEHMSFGDDAGDKIVVERIDF